MLYQGSCHCGAVAFEVEGEGEVDAALALQLLDVPAQGSCWRR